MDKRRQRWLLRTKVLGFICVLGAVAAQFNIGMAAKVGLLLVQFTAIGLLLARPGPPAG